MRATTLTLVHDCGAPPLTPDQLADYHGEPRMRDLALAERLGFDNPHNIRRLIERNQAELQGYGEVRVAVTQPSEAGGRPGKEYWLNEGQALVLCALSRTPQAAAVRRQVIEVFLAWRAGHTLPAASADRLAAVAATLDALRAELKGLRRAAAKAVARPARPAIPRISARQMVDAMPAQQPEASDPALLYGTRAIAHLGLTPRQVKHLGYTGSIPTFKLGSGRIVCASRLALDTLQTGRGPAAGARG